MFSRIMNYLLERTSLWQRGFQVVCCEITINVVDTVAGGSQAAADALSFSTQPYFLPLFADLIPPFKI